MEKTLLDKKYAMVYRRGLITGEYAEEIEADIFRLKAELNRLMSEFHEKHPSIQIEYIDINSKHGCPEDIGWGIRH